MTGTAGLVEASVRRTSQAFLASHGHMAKYLPGTLSLHQQPHLLGAVRNNSAG